MASPTPAQGAKKGPWPYRFFDPNLINDSYEMGDIYTEKFDKSRKDWQLKR